MSFERGRGRGIATEFGGGDDRQMNKHTHKERGGREKGSEEDGERLPHQRACAAVSWDG